MSFIRAVAAVLLCQSAWAGGAIRLKSRSIDGAQEAFRPRTLPRGKYWLVEFNKFPGPETRGELARRHFHILKYVPESTLMLEVPEAPDLGGLGVSWAGPMDPGDKLSRMLEEENSGAFLVEFHPGVGRRVARRIALQHG